MSHLSFHRALLGSAMALAALTAGAEARGFAVAHDFAGPPADGSYPYNNVSFDAAGNPVGTANLGGSANAGVIFEIAGGTETVLHSFDGAAGGSDPNAGVTIDAAGNLYGTTTFGGSAACRNGCGVLYELAADGTYTVLHTFNEGSDGRYPAGQLLRDRKGNLFGIATSGGPDEGGTVFEYSAAGRFRVLHAFGGSDGFEPQGNLTKDRAGDLFGVTYMGGADNYGTIFELTTTGLTTLYSFTGGADGGYPVGGVDRDGAGNLYGATNLAGNGTAPDGTVYELPAGGTLTTLYTFTGGADGGYPEGNVVEFGGKVYGTTSAGGAGGDGVVYDVDVAGKTETILHAFAGADGATPQAGPTRRHGRLYGTASGGGTDNLGVVYSLKWK